MKDYYTHSDLANEIGVSESTVIEWCKYNYIYDSIQVDKFDIWLIPKYWKERLLFSQSIEEAARIFEYMSANARLQIQKFKPTINEVTDMINPLFQKINDGHSIEHLLRVMNYALLIQTYTGGDVRVLIVASLIHDLHRYMQKTEKKYVSPEESITLLHSMISRLDLSKEQYEKVVEAVLNHENYHTDEEYRNKLNLESLIIQDADKLDAIGAVGIARTFQYGVCHNVPDYDRNIKLYQTNEYIDGLGDASTIHHIYNKLLRIDEWLHTDVAKIIALDSKNFMAKYIDRFIFEWEMVRNE